MGCRPLISPAWGESTLETAWAQNPDGPEYYEIEQNLRENRQLLAGGGAPTILLTNLPANSAWWSGDGFGWEDIRLNRAASSVVPWDIATPDFEMGFVLEVEGPYTGVPFTRPNQWALVDPGDDYVTGDVPIWAQEEVVVPGPYYDFEGLSGGW